MVVEQERAGEGGEEEKEDGRRARGRKAGRGTYQGEQEEKGRQREEVKRKKRNRRIKRGTVRRGGREAKEEENVGERSLYMPTVGKGQIGSEKEGS